MILCVLAYSKIEDKVMKVLRGGTRRVALERHFRPWVWRFLLMFFGRNARGGPFFLLVAFCCRFRGQIVSLAR